MSPRRTSPFALAVTLALGPACDPEPAVQARSLLEAGQEDTPSSGVCRGCITGIRELPGTGGLGVAARYELCVDGNVRHVGHALDMSDDRPLRDLLAADPSAPWELLDTQGKTLCAAGECTFELTGVYAGGWRSVRIALPPDSPPPTLLRMHDDSWQPASAPTIAVPAIQDGYPCPPTQPLPPTPLLPVPDDLPAGLAAITYSTGHGGIRSCSGILVAPAFILTAAHCFAPDLPASALAVRIGDEPGESVLQATSRGVSTIHRHPDANGQERVDLALLRLHEPIDDITVVPLVAPGETCTNTVTLFGFGVGVADPLAAYDWARLKRTATAARKPILAAEQLLQLIPLADQPRGVCYGDSGGPVLKRCDEQLRLVGITSGRIVDRDRGLSGVDPGLDLVTTAFAFSRGNRCGSDDDLLGYAATRLDLADIHDWITDIIALDPSPQPVEPPTIPDTK